MEITADVVKGLILLLPGFVTAGVIRALFVGEAENDFDKVVRSLIYSFVDYVVYTLILLLYAKGMRFTESSVKVVSSVPDDALKVVLLGAISVIVGCVVAFYKTNDGHRWLFHRLRITTRTTRQNLWHDVFSEFGYGYVIVNLEDGRRLFGWPYHYNDDPTQPYLFLTQAEWLVSEEDGSERRLPAGESGILVLPGLRIDTIEFFTTSKDEQKPKWRARIENWFSRGDNGRKESEEH